MCYDRYWSEMTNIDYTYDPPLLTLFIHFCTGYNWCIWYTEHMFLHEVTGPPQLIIRPYWLCTCQFESPGGSGQLMGFWQLSDIPPRGLWQWCSELGAVLAFKIKIVPPPGVGDRGNFWHKRCKWERGLWQKKMSNVRIPCVCPRRGGGPWWFTLAGAVQCRAYFGYSNSTPFFHNHYLSPIVKEMRPLPTVQTSLGKYANIGYLALPNGEDRMYGAAALLHLI